MISGPVILGVCLIATTARLGPIIQQDAGVISTQHSEVQPMTETEFWNIVDRTVSFQSDPERQTQALAQELSDLSADQLIGFQAQFDKRLAAAYRWDLWAAVYIAHGGASNDGFEYFRRWLVSKGQAVFDRVMADPDDLAAVSALVSAGPDGVLEFEEFFYVAGEVWGEKTGLSPVEIPEGLDDKTDGKEPHGEPFADDPNELARRFPKTWARFGENPLG